MTITKKQLILGLYAAYSTAKAHKSGKGYIKTFGNELDNNLEKLADELIGRSYCPQPSSCFIIEYPKKREIFAAPFRDRIVHHLYFNMTHILFERTFISDTYSCIKKRGTHYGISRLEKHILKESHNHSIPCYVLKLDQKGYFMHINREKLLTIAVESIKKMSTHRVTKNSLQTWGDVLDIDFLLWLTEVIIISDPTINCIMKGNKSDWIGLDYNKSLFNTPKGCGLPIGNLTSQLFSNVFLNVFDQFMKRELKCKHYGRYVDDSYVVSCNREWLKLLIPKIKTFLKQELGLDLHLGKLKIMDCKYGVEFLGAYIKPYRTYISNNSLNRITKNIGNIDLHDYTKAFSSVNSYIGVLNHWSAFNIKCHLFLVPNMLSVFSFNKNIKKACKTDYYKKENSV